MKGERKRKRRRKKRNEEEEQENEKEKEDEEEKEDDEDEEEEEEDDERKKRNWINEEVECHRDEWQGCSLSFIFIFFIFHSSFFFILSHTRRLRRNLLRLQALVCLVLFRSR